MRFYLELVASVTVVGSLKFSISHFTKIQSRFYNEKCIACSMLDPPSKARLSVVMTAV